MVNEQNEKLAQIKRERDEIENDKEANEAKTKLIEEL